VLIMISDGDVFDQQVADAVSLAQKEHITIYAIGVGSAAGSKIKVPNEDGTGTQYLIDEKTGKPAVTHLVETQLRRLAEGTGGAYFRAGDGAGSIDQVMGMVAAREQGRRGDTIKSPQPVGTFLLWPALALLLADLLLPGGSLLRRDRAERRKDKKKAKPGAGGKGGAAMAAALIPLGAWPQILPFALIGLGVGGVIAADLWSDGALTRRAKEAWQRRTGFVEKGVAADLDALYSPREADAPRLEDFVARWRAASDARRPALAAEAEADDALWRQELTAAYLIGGSSDAREAVLKSLRRASAARLESFAPVVETIEGLKGKLAWLSHADAQERLEDLRRAATGDFVEPPVLAPKRMPLSQRLKRALAVALIAVTAGTSVVSGVGTVRFAREQAASEAAAFQIFYGEDAYIFSDQYADARIPQIVLPALRDWNRSIKNVGPEFERAMAVLRESPDPKADNILAAAFNRAALLPLDSTAETTLLKALIERNSDDLWKSLEKDIAASGDDANAARLLVKLVDLGVEEGSPAAFQNVFRVLKSPNQQVRAAAFKALYGDLTAPDKVASFYDRLGGVETRFASDPTLQLWSLYFAYQHLAQPGAALPKKDADAQAQTADAFFDKTVQTLQALDEARAPLVVQALQAAAQAGQQAKAPTPVLAQALGLTAGVVGEAAGQDGKTPVPAELSREGRRVSAAAVNAEIKRAEKLFPGLHERLLEAGVVPPDAPTYYEYGYSMESAYRSDYELWHLQALQKELAGLQARSPEEAEFLMRAQAVVAAALKADQASGAQQGGAPAEIVASRLAGVVMKGYMAFSGDYDYQAAAALRDALAARGLAVKTSEYGAPGYAAEMDAAKLKAFRELLLGLRRDGSFHGKKLNLAEKTWVIYALRTVDAEWRSAYPASAPKDDAAGAAAVLAAVRGGDAWATALLSGAAESAAKDGVFLLDAETALLARLQMPNAGGLNEDEVLVVLPKLTQAAAASDRADAVWLAASRAVASGKLSSKDAELLKKAYEDAIKARVLQVAGAAPAAVPALADASLLIRDNLGPAHPRDAYSRHQLESLAEVARKAGLADLAARADALLKAAPGFGAPAGSALADGVERLNDALSLPYYKMPGSLFFDDMKAAGLTRPGADYFGKGAWRDSYSLDQLDAIQAHLKAMLAAGTIGSGTSLHPLTPEEKALVQGAIDATARFEAQVKASSSAHRLHGMTLAPMGLLAAAPVLGPWLWAGLAAAAATWLVWKYAFRDAPAAPPSADEAAARREARLGRIELAARRMASSVVGGSFRSFFVGSGGLDFAEARPYAGEDVREVDWKTSAKKGEIYTKKYEQEKDMPLILVVDVSGSGSFGTRGRDKRAVIEDAASALALAASRLNVRVGAILVSDRVEAVIPPRGGARHVARLIDELLSAKPAGRATDLNPAFEQALALSRSRAMVAVVSDFIAPGFKDSLSALTSRDDVRAIRVLDPAETKGLPDVGLLPTVDAESGAGRTLDTGSKRVRSEMTSAAARREARVAADLESAGVRPIVLSTEGDPLETIAAHFNPKARAH
jgi:uncharacterized protein (DUF58 family)